MKVILTERVKHLGNIGEIVKVSDGHGRNFLIPNKLAVLADDNSKQFVANKKKQLDKKIAEHRAGALELKSKIDGLVIEMTKRIGGNGKIFGNVSALDLSRELGNRGLDVEKRWIAIPNPIKSLGTFEVKVNMVSDVQAAFEVKVTMDEAQKVEIKEKQETAKKNKKAAQEAAVLAAAQAAEAGAANAEGAEVSTDNE
jgi:large subunit ribosomal protein L9